MKRKTVLALFTLCAIIVFSISGCAFLQNLVGERYETFLLTISGELIELKLPKQLSSMESAVYSYERCFNAVVCFQRFCLTSEPGHDHVDFVYISTDVIGLVWIKTVEMERSKRFVTWIYVKGVPVSATIDEMVQLIRDEEEKEDSVLFRELGKDLAELQRLILEACGLMMSQ